MGKRVKDYALTVTKLSAIMLTKERFFGKNKYELVHVCTNYLCIHVQLKQLLIKAF